MFPRIGYDGSLVFGKTTLLGNSVYGGGNRPLLSYLILDGFVSMWQGQSGMWSGKETRCLPKRIKLSLVARMRSFSTGGTSRWQTSFSPPTSYTMVPSVARTGTAPERQAVRRHDARRLSR